MLKNGFNKRGLTLPEMSIAFLLLAGLSLIAISTFRISSVVTTQAAANGEVEQEVSTMLTAIVKSAALATSCTAPTANTIRCNIARYGSTTALDFQYTLVGTEVRYQEPAGGVWTTKIRYSNIANFDVCGDTAMSGGTCPIGPVDITNAYVANVMPVTPNRFFRIRARGALNANTSDKNLMGRATNTFSTSSQVSVFVRNPSPVPNLFIVAGNPL